MKKLSFLLWIFLSIFLSFSLAIVTGIYRPHEKVNAIWMVIATACFYVLAYRFYGAFLAAKVVTLDNKRITPAHILYDGKNFYPTNKWVLFGHHFAAIAGAGPLVGPVLALQFGYLPGFLWILIGAVLAGGVHDFIILTASMRRNGKSIAQIAKEDVGPVTGVAALIAILFILIVAIASLGLVVINSLYSNPWGTFIIGMTIPIALFMGVYMKSIKPAGIGIISLIGFFLLFLTVILGRLIPSSSVSSIFNLNKNTLSILLAVYGFLASVLPVWMLLAPRDYLSSFMKIGVIFLLTIGIVTVAPDLKMPPFTKFIHGWGPVIPGTVFPFVFITIACGAISGFHSLISSGTTPKMIEKESYAMPIGYGAMLVEGFVAVIALIAAGVLIPGDYFATNTRLSFSELSSLGFPVYEIKNLSETVGVELAGRPGGAVSLAIGMAYIFSSIPFLKHLMAYWYQFALMFEALFILTTIDAGTRVARYVVQEIGGYLYKPFGDLSSSSGNILASFFVVLAWGYFIFTGSISAIWPMFGTANQLLGMLALCIGTTLLIKMGRIKYIWVTLLPMIFMSVITFTASVQLVQDFINKSFTSPEPLTLMVNAFLIGLMMILASVVVVDSAIKWYGYLVKKKPLSLGEVSLSRTKRR
ncbi:MAG: carbon starvation protein A [Nitrospirae bacterium]|nr:carbon starvation protein A [Nitrospirota bacterium]